jgi:hypothetical protein
MVPQSFRYLNTKVMNKVNRLACCLIVVGLLVGGCGSNTQESAVTENFNAGPLQTAPWVFVEARVVNPLPDVTVRLVGPDGSELASGKTRANGIAAFRNVSLPDNFRALASFENSDKHLSLEVRGFHQRHHALRLTILSTLQSEFHRLHPELSMEQVDERIRSALRLHPSVNLGVGLIEPNPVFSDLDFLRATRGLGVDGLSSLLGPAGSPSSGRSYLLSQLDLQTPITGLGADLDRRLDLERQVLARRLAASTPVINLSEDNPGNPLASDFISGPSSLGGQFLLGVGTGVTGNLVGDGLSFVFGWAAKQMGYNFGSGNQLAEIATTVTQILGAVEMLQAKGAAAVLRAQIDSLNQTLTPVVNDSGSLSTAASGTQVTDQPFVPAPSIGTLISTISQANYANILTIVAEQLVGTGNVLLNALAYQLTTATGVDQTSATGLCPWRSPSLFTSSLNLYNQFAFQQVLGMNLLAEQAHNSLLSPDPVPAINQAVPQLAQATQALKTQRQQLPLFSDPNVIVDLENGVMYYATPNGPAEWDYSFNLAQNIEFQFTMGDGSAVVYPAGDWRFPTFGEGQALQNRGRFNPTKDNSVDTLNSDPYPNAGSATAGLPGLGFNFESNSQTADPDILGSDGEIWMCYFDVPSGNSNDTPIQQGLDVDPQHTFLLNHSDNQTNGYTESSRLFSYVFCRTFGQQTSQTLLPINTAGGFVPVPSLVTGRTLNAIECLTWGLPTAITGLNATSAAPAQVSLPPAPGQTGNQTVTLPAQTRQMAASVQFTVTVGGQHTMGFDQTQTFNPIQTTYSQTLSTVDYPFLKDFLTWDSQPYAIAQALNLPGLGGILIQHSTAGAVNLKASVTTANQQVVSQQVAFTPSEANPHSLQTLQISPRNQIYGSDLSQPARGAYRLYCTGFYTDRTVASLVNQVQWSASPADAVEKTGLEFISNATGVSMQLDPRPDETRTPVNVTVTATFGAIQDSMQIQVIPPRPVDPNTLPVINGLSPTFGSTSGGYPLVLKGLRLGGAISVKVDDVPVNFVQNTNNELTVTMPAHAAGTVPIILTTSAGQADPAQFEYTD